MFPAAGSLSWHSGKATAPDRHWEPSVHTASSATSFEAGAEELRELLRGAVSERLDGSGPTKVWMSGGWDSTAVFGAGQELRRDRAGGPPLTPVSTSYPPGPR